MAEQDQLTMRPICPVCKEVEMTNEEIAKKATGKGSCWYCIADTFVQMDMETSIPNPTIYGRPGESIKAAILRSKEKHAKKPIDKEAVETGAPPAPGKVAPNLPGAPAASQLRFSDQERKDFLNKFGIDPGVKTNPSEIVVPGATEDTYMKFSIPLTIDAAEEKEIKRIMTGMLDIFGKLLKYGPQFASTLIELQAINPEMFLGGKR